MSAFYIDPRLVRMAKRLSVDARMVWMYLINHEDIHRVPGLLQRSLAGFAVEAGMDQEMARRGVAELGAAGLVSYDNDSELFRIKAMPGMASGRAANNVRGWYRNWKTMPDSPLKYEHVETLRASIGKSKLVVEAWGEGFGSDDVVSQHDSVHKHVQMEIQVVIAPSERGPSGVLTGSGPRVSGTGTVSGSGSSLGSPLPSGSDSGPPELPDARSQEQVPVPVPVQKAPRQVYEPYTDSWYEAADDLSAELSAEAPREREPGEDDEDEWRAAFGATEPPEPALEPLDEQEVEAAVEALPGPFSMPAEKPRGVERPAPSDVAGLNAKTTPASSTAEAVQAELLPKSPMVEIPEKRPWAGAVKGASDFRRVQDEFQRRFLEATGKTPDWADGQAKTLKTRVDRHGAADVLERIANAFDDPPRWFEGPPTVRSFCSHFDAFALPARAGPAKRRSGMSGADLEHVADEMERKGVT